MAKRKKITTHLVCAECKNRNYTQVVTKNRTAGSLHLNKFCARCRSHKAHKESK